MELLATVFEFSLLNTTHGRLKFTIARLAKTLQASVISKTDLGWKEDTIETVSIALDPKFSGFVVFDNSSVQY